MSTLRQQVYAIDSGRCQGCGARCRKNGTVWDWQVHHVLKQQQLRNRHVPARYLRTGLLCILLCRRCHERHESRVAPVPFESLPLRVVTAASNLGTWAEDQLRSYHPPRTVA